MTKQSFDGKGAGVLAFEYAGIAAIAGHKIKLYKQDGKWWIEYV